MNKNLLKAAGAQTAKKLESLKKAFIAIAKKKKETLKIKTIKMRCKECHKTFLSEKSGITEDQREKYQCPYCYAIHELKSEEADKKITTSMAISFTEKDLMQWANIIWEEAVGRESTYTPPGDIKNVQKNLLEMLEHLKD